MAAKKKLRTVSIFVALVLLVMTVGAMVYFSVFHDKTSAQLILAKAALDSGDKEKAYNIYHAISLADKTSEETYRALAELSEERSDYKAAGYFWAQAARLNPLDKTLGAKALECVAVSRSDNLLAIRYEEVQDKAGLPEDLRFTIAMTLLRLRKTADLDALYQTFETAQYKDLLDAYKLIAERKGMDLAQKIFEDASASKNRAVANQALMGLAICKSMTDNIDLALSLLERIEDPALALKGDKLIFEGRLLRSKGDGKKALEKFTQAERLQRGNLILVVELAELAYSMENAQVLEQLLESLAAYNKDMLTLRYYFAGLLAGVNHNWSEAAKNLEISGNFRKTLPARLLAIKCATENNDANLAALGLAALPVQDLSPQMRVNIVNALVPLLKKNQGNKNLYNAMYKLAPDNIFTNALVMRDSLEKGEFANAMSEAEKVLAADPYDKASVVVACVAALNLKRPDVVLKRAAIYLEKNPDDIDLRLLVARAYIQKGDLAQAKANYMLALRASDNAAIVAEEAGFFFVYNNFEADLKALLATLGTKESAVQKSLGLALEAEALIRAADRAGAAEKLRAAIKLTPKAEPLYGVLAACYIALGKGPQAREVFEEGIAATGGMNLKFQFALLLCEGSKEEAAEALAILKALNAARPNDKNILMMTAVAQLKLGAAEDALDSARKAQELAPNAPGIFFLIGKIMFELGRHDGATYNFERAILQDENNPEIKKMLIKALEMGIAANPPQMQKRLYLERLLRFNPTDEKAKAMLDGINKAISESRNAK